MNNANELASRCSNYKSFSSDFWLDLIELVHQLNGNSEYLTVSRWSWGQVQYRNKQCSKAGISRSWDRWKLKIFNNGLGQRVECERDGKGGPEIMVLLDTDLILDVANKILSSRQSRA